MPSEGMAAKKLTERFAFQPGKVDRTGKYPIIRDVLLCGPVSANMRRYRAEAFAGDRINRYANKPVYLDHGDGKNRGYRDKIGWIENPRIRASDGMPIGDVGIKPTHECAEDVLWDVENKPDFAGMSHVAHCETKLAADGWEDVTEMVEAESVDIVVDPATTRGYHENRNRGRTVPKTTLRAVVEDLRNKLKTPESKAGARKLLLVAEEDAAYGAMMDAPIEAPEEGGEAEDKLWDGFMNAIADLCQSYKDGTKDAATAGGEVVKYLKSHEKLMKGGKDDAPGKDGKETAPDADADEEARRRKAGALQETMDACDKAGFAPTPEQRTILSELTPATRLLQIEQYKKAAEAATAAGPKSVGRSRFAPPPTPAPANDGKPPTDPKAFAAFMNN